MDRGWRRAHARILSTLVIAVTSARPLIGPEEGREPDHPRQ